MKKATHIRHRWREIRCTWVSLRAQDRVEIEQAREQADAGEDEDRAAAHGRRRRAGEAGPDHERGGNEHAGAGDDLEPAGRPVAAARRDPGGRDEIADQDARRSGTRAVS